MRRYIVSITAGLLIFGSARAQQPAEDSLFLVGVDSFAAKISRQSTPQIIDLRTREEFELNHVTGAVNIDLRGANDLAGLEKLDKTRPVFLYAIQHNRPDIVAKQLRAKGYKEVYELRTGIAGWVGGGYPYYSSAGSELTPAAYTKVINSGRLVLVDIGTRYCGLCAKVRELVDSLKSRNDPWYKIVELELYKNTQLVAGLKEIRSVPTVILYKDGKPIWKREGLTFTKEDIETELAKAK